MTLLGPLAITITGQDTAIEAWAAVFFGILLVIIAIVLVGEAISAVARRAVQ